MASGVAFAGSGELDNGSTFALSIGHDDKNTYSASSISLTTPSVGKFTITHSGGGIDAIDDMMPTAWEETDGTSLSTGLVTATGNKGSGHVEWTAPTVVDGLSATFLWSPRSTGTVQNDKAVSGDANGGDKGGYDVVLQHSGLTDGLNVFAGYAITEAYDLARTSDRQEKVVGATYAVGGFTLGYQRSKLDQNMVGNAVTSYYENDAYGISFAVNDNLSLSYGKHESERNFQNGAASVAVEAQSVQASYTMGGATINIARSEVDNATYNSASTNDREGTTIALSLAF
jgi:outer membrane protein OmpU